MSFINHLHSTFGPILTEMMVSQTTELFLMNKHKPTDFHIFVLCVVYSIDVVNCCISERVLFLDKLQISS